MTENQLARKNLRRGFTLVELLVTIGIIALLLGIALVGLTAAKRSAQKTRVLDDFQMITMALTQYRSDFQDYPRFADPSADQASTNGQWLDYSSDRGARLLCQALISPGPVGAGAIANPGEDGADGPGFRTRRTIVGGGSTGIISGKTWGPYLQADKFKIEFNPAVANMADAKIMDSMGNVILYYPALPGPAVVKTVYVKSVSPQNISMIKPLYNAYDNTFDTTTNKPMISEAQMQYLLGDTAMQGYIGAGQSAATTAPYLLWTAGLDGYYGFGTDAGGNPKTPAPGLKTDDLTNFDFPLSVKK